ncbi:F-box-like domain protein, putative, partial [Rhizoctonia solani AG-3 Rhs1AP]
MNSHHTYVHWISTLTWKECNLILSSFLPKCKPGVLKTLTMCHDSPSGMFFDAPTGHRLPAYLSLLYTDIEIGDSAAERAEFDRVLASLTTLRLTGFYPFWTSQAYHGLIELHLLCGSLCPDKAVISEDHLIGILRASPALRTLEFSLTIVEALPSDSSISPICLEHLELLNVARVVPNKLGALLRWITPGLKPLQLVIDLDSDCDVELPDNLVTSFFARSQVSKVYTEQGNYETVLFKFLNLCPHLKTLACSSIQSSRSHIPEQDGPFISHPALETILVIDSLVDTTCLRNVINVINGCPVLREILFCGCDYMDDEPSSLCADHLQVIAELGPKVKIIDYDPTRNWGIFAS